MTDLKACTLTQSPPTPPHHAGPLVGQADTLDAIRQRLAAAQRGQGGGLALEASSGVGKTRLAWAALADAQRLGMAGLYVPCRGSQQRPAAPLACLARTLLDVALDDPPSAQHDRARQALADLALADLVPIINSLLEPDTPGRLLLPGPVAVSPHGVLVARSDPGLAPGLLRLLRAWTGPESGPRPLLVVFDDLDQASQATQQVINSLVRGIESLPVLLLVTYPPDAQPDLRAAFQGRTHPLSDLSREEARTLAAALLGVPDISDKLAQLLWQRAAGRPLMIRFATRHLKEGGEIVQDGPEGKATVGDTKDVPDIRALISALLTQLEPGPRETLLAASVLGSGLETDALRALRGDAPWAALSADLAALVAGGWLEPEAGAPPPCYRFANQLTWGLVSSSNPPDALKALHMRAGQHYASAAAGQADHRLESAVQHYLKAGDTSRALAALDDAIAEARRRGNRYLLAALLERGASVARSDPAQGHRQAELAEASGDLHASSGDYEAAARAYEDLGPPDSPPSLRGKQGLALLASDPERAARVLAGVSNAISHDYPADLRWWLEAGHAWALALTGRHYDALRHSRDTLAQLGNAAGLGMARTLLRAMLGMVLYYQGEQSEALPHLSSARSGWDARGEQGGVMLVDQVLHNAPRQDITRVWVRLALAALKSGRGTL